MAVDATNDEGQDVDAPATLHRRTCPLCEATCGLELTVEVSRSCASGATARTCSRTASSARRGRRCTGCTSIPTDCARLWCAGDDGTATWEVTWDEAFATIEAGLLPLLDEHGRDAWRSTSATRGPQPWAACCTTAPSSRRWAPRNSSRRPPSTRCPSTCRRLDVRRSALIPVPDLDRTDYLLMLGANPYASNGSLCTAPDFPGRIEAIHDRGGTLVVVDPRRTKTAERADEHLAIRPGTDAHLLVADRPTCCSTEILVDLAACRPHRRARRPRRGASPRSPPRRWPTPVASTPTPSAAWPAISPHAHRLPLRPDRHPHAEFGTLASWLVDVVNLLTGNLDRVGGAMFPSRRHQAGLDERPGPRASRTGRGGQPRAAAP